MNQQVKFADEQTQEHLQTRVVDDRGNISVLCLYTCIPLDQFIYNNG